MFSDRFEELCARKGVKPGKACLEMGVSRSLAAKWKATGTEKPSAEVLEKMAAYFGMTIDEILGKEATEAVTFDDFTYAMHNEMRDLPPEKKQMLLDMARFFKEELQRERKDSAHGENSDSV